MSIEDFVTKLHLEAGTFLKMLFLEVKKSKLNLDCNELDHLCFRVATADEYSLYKSKFIQIGSLLISAEIGGREISTFMLERPIEFEGRTIKIIELPDIKQGSNYETGFEHAEFVIAESFNEFILKYPELNFDTSAVDKKHNAELRLNFGENLSLKLHHLALEEVIRKEKLINN